MSTKKPALCFLIVSSVSCLTLHAETALDRRPGSSAPGVILGAGELNRRLPNSAPTPFAQRTPAAPQQAGATQQAPHYDFSQLGRVASVSLDVKEVASSRATDHKWETDYGSFDREFQRGKTLAVQLRNVRRLPEGGLSVDVFWFATKLANKQVFLFDMETQPCDVAANSAQDLRVEMLGLKSQVTNYAALGERSVAGAKFYGWVALVRKGDVVVDMRTSNGSLMSAMKTPGYVESVMERMP